MSKVLFIDIETTPDLGYAYGRFDTTVFDIERDWYIQSVAWKWQGEKRIHSLSLPDFKGYKSDPYDDSKLVKEIWKLLGKADIVIAHNGDRFDVKKIASRILIQNLAPPHPFKTIDTLKIAKRAFGLSSNSLDEIARQLGVGRKLDTGFKGLWKRCERGDMKAWKLMVKYNKHDILLLEGVYNRIIKFSPTFPKVHLDNGTCRKCGGTNINRRGYYFFSDKTQCPKLQCLSCGSWTKGLPEKQ